MKLFDDNDILKCDM